MCAFDKNWGRVLSVFVINTHICLSFELTKWRKGYVQCLYVVFVFIGTHHIVLNYVLAIREIQDHEMSSEFW